jgi:hypothetical protein
MVAVLTIQVCNRRTGAYREGTGMALGCRVAASLGVNGSVMDDRIHATDCVDLICDASDLGGTPPPFANLRGALLV